MIRWFNIIFWQILLGKVMPDSVSAIHILLYAYSKSPVLTWNNVVNLNFLPGLLLTRPHCEILADVTTAMVTLFQPDHPVGGGILSHSPAHPSFRPLLRLSPSLFAGRWLKITDVALREPLHCIHLALPTSPDTGWAEPWGFWGPSLQPAGGRNVCFCATIRKVGEVGRGGSQISLFWIKNKSRDFKNYELCLNRKLKTRTPVGGNRITTSEWHAQYHSQPPFQIFVNV